MNAVTLDLRLFAMQVIPSALFTTYTVHLHTVLYVLRTYNTGFANFIDEWSQCDFCFTNFGVILEYLESSIITRKDVFRLSSMWSWHTYTIVSDTQSSCGSPLTWKAQIHDGCHRVNFDRNLFSSCFVVQYNSWISMI